MWHGVLRTPRSKLFLMMKLTFFFLMLGLLEVHASVKAQVKTVNLGCEKHAFERSIR